MQVTGGQFKSIKLISPKGARSTLSIVRESIFSILNSHFGCAGGNFNGLKFLDGFSGSAIMAIEAYSRGFEVLGIEKNPACFKIAKENFKKVLGEGAELPLVAGDTLKILPKIEGVFDVIYLDPPWEADYGKILSIATAKLKNGGTIICESDKGDFKELAAERGLRVLKEKKYGRAILTVLTTL